VTDNKRLTASAWTAIKLLSWQRIVPESKGKLSHTQKQIRHQERLNV